MNDYHNDEEAQLKCLSELGALNLLLTNTLNKKRTVSKILFTINLFHRVNIILLQRKDTYSTIKYLFLNQKINQMKIDNSIQNELYAKRRAFKSL